MTASLTRSDDVIEIIAFILAEQQFAVRTTSIREIRGWAPVTPLPHCPPDVRGVMNLRGTVIPIVDLSVKLGMSPTQASERSAIVVTNVKDRTIGLLVDRVSDILTVAASDVQPVPTVANTMMAGYAEGIIAHDKQMICFLDLGVIFEASQPENWGNAA